MKHNPSLYGPGLGVKVCFSASPEQAVRMKIAVIGQSLFGQEVYKELRKDGHTIVGVFTIPDKDGKADPLGENLIGTITTKF